MKFLTTAVGQNILSRYIYMEKPGENPDSSPNPGDGGAKDKPEKKNKNNVGNGQNVPDYKVFRGKEVKRFEDEVQSLKELVGAHMNIPARVDVSNPNLLADIKRSDGSRDGIAEYKPVLIKGVDPNTGMVEIQYGDEGDLHGEIAFSDLAIDRDDLKRRHNIAPSNQSGYPTNAPRQVEYVERHPKIFKRGDVVVSDLGGPHRVYAQKDGKSPLGREVWLQPNQEAVVLMDDSGWAGGSMLIQVGQQQPVWIWKYMKHSRKPIMGKVRSGGPVPPQNQQNQPNFTNYPSNQPYQNPTYNNQYAPRNQQEPRYNNGFQRASYSQPSYPPQVAGQPQFAQQPANTQSASVLNQRINQNQERARGIIRSQDFC